VDLIERAPALAVIGEALAEADAAMGNLAVVCGSVGIGKTALLDRACDLARDRGFTALSLAASEGELGFPFGVVRQLYARPAMELLNPDERGAIAPLFGRLDDRGADLDVSLQVLDGLYWLVSDLAQETPVLIAVDDAQWADEPSLRHLVYVCRRLEGLRAMVLLAARSGEPRSVLDDLVNVAAARIEPAPLTTAGIAEMAERVLGEAPSPGFVLACLEQTGGYPLYMGELLREAKERGIRPDDAASGELERVDADGVGSACVAADRVGGRRRGRRGRFCYRFSGAGPGRALWTRNRAEVGRSEARATGGRRKTGSCRSGG
jgi:AAA ATPase domain